MSGENKDVLQKIVEGMDISDDELEFHDAVELKKPDAAEPTLAKTEALESIDSIEPNSTESVQTKVTDNVQPELLDIVEAESINTEAPESIDSVALDSSAAEASELKGSLDSESTVPETPKVAIAVEHKTIDAVDPKSKDAVEPESLDLESKSADVEPNLKDVEDKLEAFLESSCKVVKKTPAEKVKPVVFLGPKSKRNLKARGDSREEEKSMPPKITKRKDSADPKEKDTIQDEGVTKESVQTAEDKIAEEIFESPTDKTSVAEKVSTRITRRSKKDSENDKNNEEETIENIQTLLNTEVKLQNTVQLTNSAPVVTTEVKPEITEEVDHSGVFISINPKDGTSYLTEEENIDHETSNPLEPRPEIPQVMLDQLDLKKFPNLKINDKSKETSPIIIKKMPQKKNNSKLLAEIQKRMEVRKGQQRKNEPVEIHTPVIIARNRGRPRTVNLNVKPANTPVKLLPKLAPKPVEPIAKPGSIRIRSDKELKATPKTPVVKKIPITKKIEKKMSTEDEPEHTEEDTSLVMRPKSARKIKLTDKFKSFVAQEKNIRALIEQHGNTPSIPKKPAAATPRKPAADIQIKLKRKKEETSEEDNDEDHHDDEEETESADESENEKKAGRTLRNRKVQKTGTPVKKTPAKPEVKKSEAKKPEVKKTEVKKTEVQKPEVNKAESKKRPRKELISESELSDGYDEVDDEDMDPDFAHSDSYVSDVSLLSDDIMEISENGETTRTVLEVIKEVFRMMPTWNVHILPNTNSFCIAQITRGVNGIPMLKKCIEMDLDFNVKVFVHQIHYKKYDGVYDSEDHLIELLQLVDAM